MSFGFNINRCSLGGRLTADPKIKYLDNGNAVAALGIATNTRKPKDSDDYLVDFHSAEVWGAEKIEKYIAPLKKGDRVYVSGTLVIDKFTNKTGQNVERAKIIVNNFITEMMFKRPGGGKSATVSAAMDADVDDVI